MAFRRNKNLKDLISNNIIENGKVKRTRNSSGKSEKCNKNNKCCNQVVNTGMFKSIITNRSYTIREKMNCTERYLIYLEECKKCNIQYVGKTEQPMTDRITQHRSDSKRMNSPPSDRHFTLPGHDFERDARFTLIEKLKNLKGNKEELRKRLKTRENFWIRELKTLQPRGLNVQINKI